MGRLHGDRRIVEDQIGDGQFRSLGVGLPLNSGKGLLEVRPSVSLRIPDPPEVLLVLRTVCGLKQLRIVVAQRQEVKVRLVVRPQRLLKTVLLDRVESWDGPIDDIEDSITVPSVECGLEDLAESLIDSHPLPESQ